jgi:hypothetical protein
VTIIRMLAEKSKALGQPLYLTFVDMEKAFDRVNRELLWRVLGDELQLQKETIAQI